MIKVLHRAPDEYTAILVCDVCGRRIQDAGSGAVLTVSYPIPVGEQSKVLHVHDGACYETAESHLGHILGHETVWRHLHQLLASVGLTPGQLQAFSLAVPGADWTRMPKAA